MEFMEMLEEWLAIRDDINNEAYVCLKSVEERIQDRKRSAELSEEINKRARGEI